MQIRNSAFVVSALVLLAAGCGGSSGTTGTTPTTPNTPTTTPVATTSVSLVGSSFNPPDIKVSPGATVTFTNQDGISHNVTFTASGITSSGDFVTGSKSIVMPAAPGTYGYRCTIHAGMTGTVLVQ